MLAHERQPVDKQIAVVHRAKLCECVAERRLLRRIGILSLSHHAMRKRRGTCGSGAKKELPSLHRSQSPQ
jgi:hypothetical protein